MSRNGRGYALWLLNILLAVYFITCAYLGWFTRYASDDFCWGCLIRQYGFWRAQYYWFNQWMGRFAFLFTINLIETIGEGMVRVVPGLCIVAWTAALFWAIRQFGFALGGTFSSVETLLLAQIILFATLQGSPVLCGGLYWQTGTVTYGVPLILLTLFAGMIAQRLKRNSDGNKLEGRGARVKFLTLAGVFSFWIAGYSETNALLQAALLFIALTICCLSPDGSAADRLRSALRIAFAACIAALAIMALMPGTVRRLTLRTDQPQGFSFLVGASVNALIFVASAFRISTPSLVSVFLICFIFGVGDRTEEEIEGETVENGTPRISPARIVLLLPFLAFVLLWACFIPSAYVSPQYPDARVLGVPQFVLAGFMGAEGYLISALLKRRVFIKKPAKVFASSIALLFFAITILLSTASNIRLLPSARAFASAWDARERLIVDAKRKGLRTIRISAIKSPFGNSDIGEAEWVISNAACFYGLNSIERESGKTAPRK